MSAVPLKETEVVPRAVWNSTLLLVGGRLWAALCGFGCLACLTREDLPWTPMPGAEFGHLTFYLALFVLLDGLADFGTSTATIQLGADEPRILAAAIRSGRRIRAVAALVGWLLVSASAWLSAEPALGWIALASLAPVTRAAELSSVLCHSELRWRLPVLMRSLVASLRLVLFACLAQVGVLHFGPYLGGFALLGALGNLATYLILRPRLRRLADSLGTIPWQALLLGALPLAVLCMAQQAYFYGDNLILRALVSAEELGRYNAAVKLLSLLIMVSALATGCALPWLTRRSREGNLAAAGARLWQATFPLACLILGGLWPLAPRLMAAIYGAPFASAGTSLQWLLLAAAAIYAGAPLLTALAAAGRSRALLGVVLSGLGFNLVMNAILIPGLASAGAALATLGTELLVGLGAWLALRRAGLEPRLTPLVMLSGPLLFALGALLGALLPF